MTVPVRSYTRREPRSAPRERAPVQCTLFEPREELERLRARILDLERQLARKGGGGRPPRDPNAPDRRLERTLAWLTRYPFAYPAFEWLALREIRSGRKNLGPDWIVNQLRWNTSLRAEDGPLRVAMGGGGFEEMLLDWNDLYTAPLARLFQRFHPEHAGFFRTRVSFADRLLTMPLPPEIIR